MKLHNFGIRDGISEVIATTISKEGGANAAPIGIISDDIMYVKLYPDTHTYSNIRSTRKLVANIVSDPLLFVSSAIGDLGEREFYVVDGLPVLRCADAWALFKCEEDRQDSSLIYLHLIRGNVIRKSVRAINRGTNAVIEATVHATRYAATKDEKYLNWIAHYGDVVRKCGGAREKEAMKKLRAFLKE